MLATDESRNGFECQANATLFLDNLDSFCYIVR